MVKPVYIKERRKFVVNALINMKLTNKELANKFLISIQES